MGGISGYFHSKVVEISAGTILRMTREISHRGPDDEGLTLILPESARAVDLLTSESAKGVPGRRIRDDEAGGSGGMPHRVAFGARRFSTVDLSPAGHQPFWSRDRQVCLAFNGEIYNYVELRQELEALGHIFRTECDTEVLMESYREWGTGCFGRFNGAWALSLYDAQRRAVLLARDRIGQSPLYVAKVRGGLLWSSEIKGIFAAAPEPSVYAVREQAVSDFIVHGWRDVFHETFYERITTFPNASYAWIEPDGSYSPRRYWALPQHRLGEKDIGADEAVERFGELLSDAVRLRMRADVPVGFELSGGMDSSAITGLAARAGADLQTFTVSFPGAQIDEEPYARKVAERYPDRISHTVLVPPEDAFFEQADYFVWMMTEPFHSPILLTNRAMWQTMAERGIRVSMNGIAGDALLAGHASDYFMPYLHSLLRDGRYGRSVSEFLAFSERRPGRLPVDAMRLAYHLLPRRLKPLRNPSTRIPSSCDPFVKPMHVEELSGPAWEIQQRLLDDMGDWGMNYWLRSGSQACMSVPIEVRGPFLDYRLVQFAFSLPVGYLIRDGWLKWILREAVREVLPPDVVWRKVKLGFPFPYTEWLLASEGRFFDMIGPFDCPYVSLPALRAAYPVLSRRNPLYLWRVMSVALWWKRCVQGDRLS